MMRLYGNLGGVRASNEEDLMITTCLALTSNFILWALYSQGLAICFPADVRRLLVVGLLLCNG